MKNFIREMKKAGIKGVLSDIDGTLLDSMGLWYDIDVAFMKMKGISMPSDLQMQIAGMSMYETALYFRRTFGIEDSPEVLMETWNDMARDAYLHRIELKAGAEEFLNALLDEGIPVALATSNSRHLVESSIERHEVFNRLYAIVTADEIQNGKPAPDVYIEAAKKIGIAPSDCLVFEDVIQGVRAGNAAGARVIAIDDPYSSDYISEKKAESIAVIKDFTELDQLKLEV